MMTLLQMHYLTEQFQFDGKVAISLAIKEVSFYSSFFALLIPASSIACAILNI